MRTLPVQPPPPPPPPMQPTLALAGSLLRTLSERLVLVAPLPTPRLPSPPVAPSPAAIDWHAEARSGSLPRRTVAELQLYLRRHGLRVTGKKDDLLQRVTTHMGEQGG